MKIKGLKNPLNIIYVILCLAVIAGISFYVFYLDKTEDRHISEGYEDSLYVYVKEGKRTEIIKSWMEEETIYFFLPSYAKKDNIFIGTLDHIGFNGSTYYQDSPIKNVEYGRVYTIEDLGENNIEAKTIVFLKSSNLGTVFIDTESGGIDYLYEDKDNKENANMRLYTQNGTVQYDDDLEFLSGRGNQTWGYDKRSWSIKTLRDVSLLGMEADSKWALIANVAEDSDGIRNRAVYKLAEYIGLEYTSEMTFVDVYLNGGYFGTYELTEKIEASNNRMNIGSLSEDNSKTNGKHYAELSGEVIEVTNDDGSFYTYSPIESPANITGGYIVERNYGNKWAGKKYRFKTAGGECFNVREPSVLSEDEAKYLLSVFQSVENALFADDYTDSLTGKKIDDLIDLESWAKKFLVEEISKNSSAGTTSSYFYLKRNNGRIYAGPVWDYDKSLGTTGIFRDAKGLTYCSIHSISPTYWWKEIYQYEPFLEKVKTIYAESGKKAIETLLNNNLEEWEAEIANSFIMNYYRWSNSYGYLDVVNVESLKNNAGDIDYSVSFLKDWLKEREDFLDEIWIEDIVYHNVYFYSGKDIIDIWSIVEGEEIADYKEVPEGYYLEDINTGETIDEHTVVYREYNVKLEKSDED